MDAKQGSPRGRTGRVRRIGLIGLIAIPVLLGSLGGAAWAYWSAASATGGNGAAAATTVNAGATPTASVSGSAVTVSWAASTLATGQAVSGYQVKRYNATTLVLQTILSACTGTVSATSCVESGVPDGTWKYTVTPVFATNWLGAESAKSATVTVDTIAPTNNVALSNVTGGAFKSGNSVYYLGTTPGSFTLTNALTDAGSGSASSQTTALTGTTTGWTHTPSTVSTPVGGPYVSNAFSWTTSTTSGPGEAVTGRDVTGNTSVTNLTFTDDITAPSAGTISYVNGLTGGTTVSVSFTTGTDGGSGIGTRLLQRASAAATMAGACGTFGAFATVAGGTNPTSPVADTVALGSCYEYQYVVSDKLGNSTTATSSNVARAPYGATYAFDDGTGSSAVDSSGMGNTATLQAGATWTTGRFGSAVNLTGANNSYVDIPNPVIDTSKSYSVALWVKLNTVTGGNQTFAAIDGTTISPFFLQLEGSRFKFTERGADAVGSAAAQVVGPIAATGEWYHLVGVYDQSAGTIQLYVNGISQGTTAYSSGWTASGHTTIGRAKYGGPVDLTNGAIDDVHFYDRAITASEIVALRGPFGAYYAFDAGSGTTAVDSTGDTNTGALQAAAGWTTGKIGPNALNLNGTSTSYVDVNTPVIDTSQSYTVATWVKLNNLTTFQTFASVDGANISPFFLQLTNTGVFRFAQYATDSTGAASVGVNGLSPTAGTWYHIAGVYDGTAHTIQLYVNGVSQGSATAVSAWTAYGHSSVGRSRFTNPTDFVNGALDETHFYAQALSSAQISALAGSYSTVISGTPGLLSYWRLGEAAGITALDAKGFNNGTYANSPTLSAAGAITNDSNTAVQFNGTNNYVSAINGLSNDFSVELWFKTTQNYSNDLGNPHCTQWWQGAGLVDADVGGSANDFGTSICGGQVVAGVGNPDTSVVSPLTYNDGLWHQMVFTRTKSTGAIVLYVDGAAVASSTGNTNALTASIVINFGRSTSNTNYFAGTLDEIATYSTALTPATVSAHYVSAR